MGNSADKPANEDGEAPNLVEALGDWVNPQLHDSAAVSDDSGDDWASIDERIKRLERLAGEREESRDPVSLLLCSLVCCSHETHGFVYSRWTVLLLVRKVGLCTVPTAFSGHLCY